MIICLTLPILKRHSCWSFQIQQHVVRPCNELLNCALDTQKKTQLLPFSDVVNHMPLSELLQQGYNTLWAGNTPRTHFDLGSSHMRGYYVSYI